MRARSFQQTMLQLATIAALLLALMPTFGRFCAPEMSASADGSTWLCTMSGLKPMQAPDALPMKHSSPTGNAQHDDCAYCPLLAAMAGLAMLIVLLLPQRAVVTLRTRLSSPRIVGVYPCGLGSRGPPLFA